MVYAALARPAQESGGVYRAWQKARFRALNYCWEHYVNADKTYKAWLNLNDKAFDEDFEEVWPDCGIER